MLVKFINWNTTYLIGMSFYGDPFSNSVGWTEENEIGQLWNRFKGFYEDNPEEIKNISERNIALELWIETADSQEKGFYEIFTGVLVDKIEEIPLACVAKKLPATTYAVFTLKGEEISADWTKKIYQEWLPASNYDLSYNYSFQYYDERFKGVNNIAESELDVYVPVIQKR